jgi:hypothetical protein
MGFRGLDELRDEGEPAAAPDRVRRAGAGRPPLVVTDPTVLEDLKELVEPTTRGDPEAPLLWTARSLRNLAAALRERGHRIGHNVVADLLRGLGYSLQANRKTREGANHPDRNDQFEYINKKVKRALSAGEPAISVDTKKKELVGDFKNGGREYGPRSTRHVSR